jgi:hypothetical protein
MMQSDLLFSSNRVDHSNEASESKRNRSRGRSIMRWLVIGALIPTAACGGTLSGDDDTPGVRGQGEGSSRTYAVTDFTQIDQRGPDDVDVRVGAGFSVHAEGDPDALDRLKIVREGNRLRISRKTTGGIGWSSGSAKVFVTMPRIEAARLAGAGDVAIDRVDGAAFTGDIAGAGSLGLNRVTVDALKLLIAGSGTVTAAGQAQEIDVSIAGAGDVDGKDLRGSRASVKIAGTGNVQALIDGDASVSIMGTGDVDLGPKARCKVSKMGTGDVRCGG